MNPCIGDRQIDPPDDGECDVCGGCGQYQEFVGATGDWDVFDCPHCHPGMIDPGEPNDYPD